MGDAALKGYVEIARILLDHAARVNEKNAAGAAPLHDAALGGHRDVAALLLDHGADIDARDDSGATPLYDAASWGSREVVDLLLHAVQMRVCETKPALLLSMAP